MTDAGERTRRQLIDLAESRGYEVTERLIVDWTARGLLGKPRRRGTGRGSAPGVFSEHQARLFIELLRLRQSTDQIANLANVPVWLWVHWGNDYVTTTQVRKALRTWAGPNLAGPASRVAITVQELINQADARRVSSAVRQQLSDVLGSIVSGAPIDFDVVRAQLIDALRALYPPTQLALPMVEAQADVIECALLGGAPFANQTDEQVWSNAALARARAFHVRTLADYKAANPWKHFPASGDIPTAALDFVKVLGFERRALLIADSERTAP
jgi:hypothetical protein